MAITVKPSRKISGNFKDWLKDYLQNSSVAGCAYYVTAGRPSKERIFWLAVHITSIIFIVVMTMEATLEYSSNPTVTTIETDKFPVQEIDFPGVAICSVNKISRRAAMNFAEDILIELKYLSAGNFTLEEIMEMIKYMGNLYLFEYNENEREKIELLHKLLTLRYKIYASDPTFELLRPKCNSILEYCRWADKEVPCEDLFARRKTGDGICCTFNYGRRSDDFGVKNLYQQTWSAEPVVRSPIIGPRFGLTVLLKNNLNDDYYKTLPILGYKILIFSPLDYPDVSSGNLHEVIVPSMTESFITLQATTLYSHPDVSMYRENERDCRFSHELSRIFEGYYSYSDCLMYCRLVDVIARCDCLPFYYPIPSELDYVRICDLMDLQCLNKNKNRWWSVRPRNERFTTPYDDDDNDDDDDDDDDDLEGSNGVLNCSECLPACTDVLYDVSVNSAPLSAREVHFGKTVMNMEGHSIVHVFFGRTGVVKLRQDVLFYWYELMSNYGGICGFFLGISIIGIVEFLYFFTLRLYKRVGKSEGKKNSSFTFVKAARPSHRPLYWKEMVQPNFKY